MAHFHASQGVFGGGKPHACDAIRFFIEEDYVGDVADLGAFVADIFLYIEDGTWIFLEDMLGG